MQTSLHPQGLCNFLGEVLVRIYSHVDEVRIMQ